MSRPEDLRYTTTHEWVRLEGDVATVGITDHAVEQLSDLAFVDLPRVGTKTKKGAAFGEIESTKTVAELVAPVSGEVSEVNTAIVEQLQLLQQSPFGDGWLVKIRCSSPPDLSDLLDARRYQELIDAESH